MRFTPWGHAARRVASIKHRSAANRKHIAPRPCAGSPWQRPRAQRPFSFRASSVLLPARPLPSSLAQSMVRPWPLSTCRALVATCMRATKKSGNDQERCAIPRTIERKRTTTAVLVPTTGRWGGRSPASASDNGAGGGTLPTAARRRPVPSSVSAIHLFEFFSVSHFLFNRHGLPLCVSSSACLWLVD